MSRVFAMLFPLLVASCAQRGTSGVADGGLGTWSDFVGTMQSGGDMCTATYLGTDSNIRDILGYEENPVKDRKTGYILTALHCVNKYLQGPKNSLKETPTITWGNGAQSKLVSLYTVGHESSASGDDVAVGYVETIGDLEPVHYTNARAASAVKAAAGIQITRALVGDDVTILGSGDNLYKCKVSAEYRAQAYYEAACKGLNATTEAPGQSGALVVDGAGQPVGVFLGSLAATFKFHNLATGALRQAALTPPGSDDFNDSGQRDQVLRYECKPSLASHQEPGCIGTATPTREQVQNFLDHWYDQPKGGLSCTKSWMEKFWSGTEKNGVHCKFNELTSDEALKARADFILGEDDRDECTVPVGGPCQASDTCTLKPSGKHTCDVAGCCPPLR